MLGGDPYMPAILSACLVLYHCGDEAFQALQCIQNADLEVAVYLCDNSPEEMTAERLKWAFHGVTLLPQEKNIGFGRAHNAVLPYLKSKYGNNSRIQPQELRHLSGHATD